MVDGLETQVQQIAGDFRRGATALGNEQFTVFCETLEHQVIQHERDASTILQVLREALVQHQRGDYIGLADALEYELLPKLLAL